MPRNKGANLPAGHALGKGRYLIKKKIGEGGYGSVYLAEDTRLGNRKVAVKELIDTSAQSQQLFTREANLLASLNHPGLVRVSDFFPEGPSYYLVMDYIEGQDLLDLVIKAEAAHQMLPIDEATQWMIRTCEAVAYLHQQSPPIIHRDIKPSNIRMNTQQQPILVDFGIAKIDPNARTQVLAKAVSAGFSPPEQYGMNSSTSMCSDVYALGATLYCLITIKPPPDGFERLTEDVPLTPPRQHNPKISQALEDVVLKAMDLNTLNRYQDANEMLAALQAAAGASAAPAMWMPVPLSPAQVCPKCTQALRPGARFCPFCGINFSPAHACLQCGSPTRPGSRFCWKCRAQLKAAAPAQDPNRAAQLANQGDQYYKSGQMQMAVTAYEQAILLGLSHPVLFANLGHCYIQINRGREAVSLLEKFARQYTRDAGIHFRLAQAYLNEKQLSQGIQTLEVAYTLAPDSEEISRLLLKFHMDMGKHSKAIPILENLLRRNPRDTELRPRLAVAYIICDRISEAEYLVRDMLRENHPESLMLSALVNLKKGNPRQAMKEFQMVLKREPDNALAHYFIGDILMDQKKWRDAVSAFQNAARANPQDADPHAKMCLCYIALGRHSEAIDSLDRALTIDPHNKLGQTILNEMKS